MIAGREIQEQIVNLRIPVNSSFTKFLETVSPEDLFDCGNFTEHVSVSAIIVHLFSREILLLQHKSLNQWILPGGHVSFDDKSIVDAVLREVSEKTGLTREQFILMNEKQGRPYCVEINKRQMPYNSDKGEDAHIHYDFCFVFGYSGGKDIEIDIYENREYKWFSVDDFEVKQLFEITVDDVVLNGLKHYEEQIRKRSKNEYLITPLAWYQCNVADSYRERNLIEQAKQMYLESIDSFEKTYNDEYETPPYILNAIWRLAILYGETGQEDLKKRLLCKGLEFSKMYACWDSNFEKTVSLFQQEIDKMYGKYE